MCLVFAPISCRAEKKDGEKGGRNPRRVVWWLPVSIFKSVHAERARPHAPTRVAKIGETYFL